MKTQSRWTRHAILLAASMVLAFPALAAPHLDSALVGKWHGTLSAKQNGPAKMDLSFMPDGTERLMITAPKEIFAVKATYITKPGTIIMTMVSATDNGKPVHNNKKEVVKYKVTAATLTLDHGDSEGPVVLHRVKG